MTEIVGLDAAVLENVTVKRAQKFLFKRLAHFHEFANFFLFSKARGLDIFQGTDRKVITWSG